MRPKVTVYITCRDYGRFVEQAIESVYHQLYDDWELLIIDDGSVDDSAEIIDQLAKQDSERVRTVHNVNPMGLPACANMAMDLAKGQYLIRLDADDYLDESALLTMATFLDKNPNTALVFPNYIYIDEDGSYLGLEHRNRVNTESKVLDLPAHGACTMVRKRVLKAVGGYNAEHQAQDGHQVWFKILHRYKIANVATALFYYRQHSASLSRNQDRLLEARRQIKREVAARHDGDVKVRVVGVIPARNMNTEIDNVCLTPLGGRTLIDYTLEAASASSALDHILVASDDLEVLEHCQHTPGILSYQRTLDLSLSHTKLVEVMRDAVRHLEEELDIYPDVLVMLNVHAPMTLGTDIDEAVDTLLLLDVDSVSSVYEDRDLHFTHGQYGMTPLNWGALNDLYLEREALYVDTGAMKVIWRDVLSGPSLFGTAFGHVIVPWERSFIVRDSFSLKLIEELIERSKRERLAAE